MPKHYFYFNLPETASDEPLPERALAVLDAAGYTIDLHRVVIDRAPPSKPSSERPALDGLLRRMKAPDVLVVTHLAFLGCSVRDVLATLDRSRKAGLRVHCAEIGAANLAGAATSVAVRTMTAIAEMERQSASARTRAYLGQARDAGRQIGRPSSLTARQRARILDRLLRGVPVSEIARQFQTSRQTIMRVREKARAA